MKGVAQRAWGYILEIFFAPACVGCGKYLDPRKDKNTLVCEACFNGILVYKTVFYGTSFTLVAVSSYDNRTVRELLHALKYRRFLGVVDSLEKLIQKYLDGLDIAALIPQNPVIIPIPLHKKRLRERGFNQAEEISNILSKQLSLPVDTKILYRTLDTPHQTILKNREKRKESVKNSFTVNDKIDIRNKNFLLVDDVYTSGATMSEAVRTLRGAGAKEIFGFVVAKTT